MPYSPLISTSPPVMAGTPLAAASIDVPAHELADFHEHCARAGLDAATFGVTATERLPPGRLDAQRHVHVSRGAVSMSYDASSGAPWIEPVVRDMGAGLFG
jgi:hypothetical protein